MGYRFLSILRNCQDTATKHLLITYSGSQFDRNNSVESVSDIKASGILYTSHEQGTLTCYRLSLLTVASYLTLVISSVKLYLRKHISYAGVSHDSRQKYNFY